MCVKPHDKGPGRLPGIACVCKEDTAPIDREAGSHHTLNLPATLILDFQTPKP